MTMLESTLKTLLENTADSTDRAERLVLIDLARQIVEKMEKPEPANAMLVMTGYGDRKIHAIKALRSITQLGLKQAKEAVESCPIVMLPANHPNAALVKRIMGGQGATLELRGDAECAVLPKVDMNPDHWRQR